MEDFKEKLFLSVLNDKEQTVVYVVEKMDYMKYLFDDQTKAQKFIDECKKKNEYRSWFLITSEKYF